MAESLSYVADPTIVAGGVAAIAKGGGKVSSSPKACQRRRNNGRLSCRKTGALVAGAGSGERRWRVAEKAATAGEAAGGTVSAGTTAATVMGAGTAPVTTAV